MIRVLVMEYLQDLYPLQQDEREPGCDPHLQDRSG